MSEEKKLRYFYYEEGVDAWCPVPDDPTVLLEHLTDGDDIEIRYKAVLMTDEEYENLPEGE